MKVGDYVRTPQGVIAKIIDIKEETGQYFLNGNAVSLESKNYIADKNITIGENFKHSSNIINLIEVGDYVNGGKVYEKEEGYIVINADFGRIFEFMNIYEKDIRTIVTHEQFSQMEYKVGDE